MSDKEKIIEAVKELPKDATFDDALEKIYFIQKMEKRLKGSETGLGVSHEEAKQQLKKWLE